MSTTPSTERGQRPISLADEENVKQVLVGAVLGLWDVVGNLTRLRPSRRERYRWRAGPHEGRHEGAAEAGAPERNRSIGIRVDLPSEQEANAFVEQVFEHRTFFTRLHHFVLASDAFVVAPGGIGTVLEATMIWQLLQVHHLVDTPLIMVGRMWSELVQWARASMLDSRLHLVNPEDLSIPRCVVTGDEAIALIRVHHARWLHACERHERRPER